MKFLDCTLRDGGYYNNWDFPIEIVNDYLSAAVELGVDIVELGLRSKKNNGYKGPAAFCTEAFIESLNVPRSVQISVMINASEFSEAEDYEEALEKLFPRDTSTKISVVRVACHASEFIEVLPVADILSMKGFTVGFNIMQIASCSASQIEELARVASEYRIDVLYFADSLGSMDPKQVEEVVASLRKNWAGEIGIHAHDNLGLALTNTLKALECGASWVDSTFTGMGRGPGNAKTEEIAIEISSFRNTIIDLVPACSIIDSYFRPMKYQCSWGTNVFYYLAGKHSIHPTYIQEMIADPMFSSTDIITVINQLKDLDVQKYNNKLLLNVLQDRIQGSNRGEWCPAECLAGQDVLLLGTGPSVRSHINALQAFIHKYKPIVIALNMQDSVMEDLISYRVASNPVRILADAERYLTVATPLILPFKSLTLGTINKLFDRKILDFGLSVSGDKTEIYTSGCSLPTSLVMDYAFSVCVSGNVKNVFLAGFDGYRTDHKRNVLMNSIIQRYRSLLGGAEVVSITETMYDLDKRSVYGYLGYE
jgi:4-hydroxy 2-oxovalerate aldolase